MKQEHEVDEVLIHLNPLHNKKILYFPNISFIGYLHSSLLSFFNIFRQKTPSSTCEGMKHKFQMRDA